VTYIYSGVHHTPPRCDLRTSLNLANFLHDLNAFAECIKIEYLGRYDSSIEYDQEAPSFFKEDSSLLDEEEGEAIAGNALEYFRKYANG